MKIPFAIVAVLCFACPVLAQAPATGSQQNPPAQHQPGTPAQPAAPAHTPGQTAKPASAASDEKVDPAKDAAIRHLMDITETSRLGENLATFLTGQVHDAMGRTLTPENLSKFMDTFSKKFSATAPGVSVGNAMVPIYSKAFSMEDIQGLIQFYESPLGQHVVKALPDVVQQSQNAGIQIEQANALSVLRGMSDEYPELKQILPPENAPPAAGADAAPAKAPTPSPAPTPPTPKPAPKPAPAPPPQ